MKKRLPRRSKKVRKSKQTPRESTFLLYNIKNQERYHKKMFTKALYEDLDRFAEQQLTEAKRYAYGYQNYDDYDPGSDYRRIHRNYANQGDVSNFTTNGYGQDYTLPDEEQVKILQGQKDTLGKVLKQELATEKKYKARLQASIDNGASREEVRDFKVYIKHIDERIAEIKNDLERMYSDVDGGYQEESLEEDWFDDIDPSTNPYRTTGVHRDLSATTHYGYGNDNRYQVSPEESDRLYKKNIELWKSQGKDPKTFPPRG